MVPAVQQGVGIAGCYLKGHGCGKTAWMFAVFSSSLNVLETVH